MANSSTPKKTAYEMEMIYVGLSQARNGLFAAVGTEIIGAVNILEKNIAEAEIALEAGCRSRKKIDSVTGMLESARKSLERVAGRLAEAKKDKAEIDARNAAVNSPKPRRMEVVFRAF